MSILYILHSAKFIIFVNIINQKIDKNPNIIDYLTINIGYY
jgi:hypothetical protein